MKKNHLGQPILTVDEALTSMLNGSMFDNWVVTNDTEQQLFNAREKFLGGTDQIISDYKEEDTAAYHKARQLNWSIPQKYIDLDTETYLCNLCDTDAELSRVLEELDLYKLKGLYPILNLMIYLTDIKKQNNIVWGVGRGSSVASYCLFLIGVHKINSLAFNIDIGEFLK